MATLEEVQAQIAKLQADTAARVAKLEAQARALVAARRIEVLDDIHKLMAEHGIATAEIDAHIDGKMRALGQRRDLVANQSPATKTTSASKAAAVEKKNPPPAKYRDPRTGATWSGFGRAPAWLADVTDRSMFLIAPTPANVTAEAMRAAKAESSVSELEPPLQRNPKTGETWDGHGLVPAWALKVGNMRIRRVIPVVPADSAIPAGQAARKSSSK